MRRVLLTAASIAALAMPSITKAQTSDISSWDHNGSVVYLVANGESRQFFYSQPRAGMLEAGVRPDSLLFTGKSIDGRYVGMAYIFNKRCGRFGYQVSGPILDDYRRVLLRGQAPRIGPNCRIQGYITDTLEFTLSQSHATSGNATNRGVKLPPTMLGTWCFDEQTTEDAERYARSECLDEGESWIVIGPDSFKGYDLDCESIKASLSTDRKYNDIYTVRYRCHHGSLKPWNETLTMWLGKAEKLIIVRKQDRS
jgi:hypothetical protein